MGFSIDRIKGNAKQHYDCNKWNNVLVFLATWVLSYAASMILSTVVGAITGAGSVASALPAMLEGDSDSVAELAAASAGALASMISSLASLALSIFFTNVLSMGSMTWYHKAINEQGLGVGRIFDGFTSNYMSNVAALALKTLFIGLWSLLFVIPGIVKTYAYFGVEYIKAECPDMPASKTLDLSNRMTNGHKMDLFLLDLSFIGWFLLAGITCYILGVVYVFPYYNAAKAFAYEEIKADAIASGRVSAEEFI